MGTPFHTCAPLLGAPRCDPFVGDLAKLVQVKAGVRPRADLDAALAHELADCLWAVLTLADAYDVDLETAFDQTMHDLTDHLDHWGDTP